MNVGARKARVLIRIVLGYHKPRKNNSLFFILSEIVAGLLWAASLRLPKFEYPARFSKATRKPMFLTNGLPDTQKRGVSVKLHIPPRALWNILVVFEKFSSSFLLDGYVFCIGWPGGTFTTSCLLPESCSLPCALLITSLRFAICTSSRMSRDTSATASPSLFSNSAWLQRTMCLLLPVW